MRELPILFSAPMVRAILDGRKTQTRRVSGLDVINAEPDRYRFLGMASGPGTSHAAFHDERTGAQVLVRNPYGEPGDRLWVRETWGYRCGVVVNPTTQAVIEYRADAARATLPVPVGRSGLPKQRPNMTDQELLAWWESWRPSIHMPRWASRMTLEVTDVRVDRLLQLTYEDAVAEGVVRHQRKWYANDEAGCPYDVPQGAFSELWESINGAGSWGANPRVWVVEFRRLEQEVTAR